MKFNGMCISRHCPSAAVIIGLYLEPEIIQACVVPDRTILSIWAVNRSTDHKSSEG